MASAKDLDMMQTYLFGRVDILNYLIDSVDGPGSRRFKLRLMGVRDGTRQRLEQITRELIAAREAKACGEAASEVKAQGVAGS